jgi:hypothetical protein
MTGEQWYSFRSSFQSSEAFEEVEAAIEAETAHETIETIKAAEEGRESIAFRPLARHETAGKPP